MSFFYHWHIVIWNSTQWFLIIFSRTVAWWSLYHVAPSECNVYSHSCSMSLKDVECRICCSEESIHDMTLRNIPLSSDEKFPRYFQIIPISTKFLCDTSRNPDSFLNVDISNSVSILLQGFLSWDSLRWEELLDGARMPREHLTYSLSSRWKSRIPWHRESAVRSNYETTRLGNR